MSLEQHIDVPASNPTARIAWLEAENERLRRTIDNLRTAFTTQQQHLRSIATIATMTIDPDDG